MARFNIGRAIIRVLVLEFIIVMILATLLGIGIIRYMEILDHDEWPIYRSNPTIIGPLIGRELAAIAPFEIDTICGDGMAKELVVAWRESRLPRIDRVRRHLHQRRWLVRAMFENTSSAERELFKRLVCQPDILIEHTQPLRPDDASINGGN
ncbi:MAG: hypothetical protein KI792_04845 [Alphaproteobacteria bacterium]|nr:hypothetical protein [Alphaproteobacteria bacterium SS10]